MTKLGTLSGYQGNTYSAYGGPDVGGFGLVPQSAVPDVGVDDETRRRLLGDENTPPSWYVGTNPNALPLGDLPPVKKSGGATLLGPLSAYNQQVAAAPPAAPPTMMNETLAAKGFAPRQLNQEESNQFALYDKMLRQQQAQEAEAGKGRGATENFAISAQKRLANNILGLPSAIADVGTLPGRTMFSLATKGELPSLSVMPYANVDDIAAGMRGVEGAFRGENPREAFNKARENIDLAEGARTAARPTSTFWGNVGGDVASLVAGRLPLASAVVRAAPTPRTLARIRAQIEAMPPGSQRHFKRVMNMPFMSEMKRGLTKAGEVGLEGATLGLLNQGDPISTGAWAAGGQAAGSLAMSLIHHPLRGLGALGAGIVGWQMLKELVPGGRDRILESIEHVIRHATWGTVVGGAAGLLGAGRYRGSGLNKTFGAEYARDLPKYAEGVNAALRANPISIIEQINNDMKAGKPILGPILENLSNNVQAFTDAELKRLSKSMEGSDLRGTVERMLENPDFKARMGL